MIHPMKKKDILKNQIIESIKKNNDQKNELQKLLLDLLNNKGDSMNSYIHILKEKDKLFKITKQYEKEIENYAKIQKQKDEDINKINRTIEVLKAKLKELFGLIGKYTKLVEKRDKMLSINLQKRREPNLTLLRSQNFQNGFCGITVESNEKGCGCQLGEYSSIF